MQFLPKKKLISDVALIIIDVLSFIHSTILSVCVLCVLYEISRRQAGKMHKKMAQMIHKVVSLVGMYICHKRMKKNESA